MVGTFTSAMPTACRENNVITRDPASYSGSGRSQKANEHPPPPPPEAGTPASRIACIES